MFEAPRFLQILQKIRQYLKKPDVAEIKPPVHGLRGKDQPLCQAGAWRQLRGGTPDSWCLGLEG